MGIAQLSFQATSSLRIAEFGEQLYQVHSDSFIKNFIGFIFPYQACAQECRLSRGDKNRQKSEPNEVWKSRLVT